MKQKLEELKKMSGELDFDSIQKEVEKEFLLGQMVLNTMANGYLTK